MHIIFLGAPGSGKGTQSKWIEEEFQIPHISTGDMFRAAVAQGTPAGQLAKSYMDKGMLVPDDVTIAIVEERLHQKDCQKGFLFDGFPRTIAQAEALDNLTRKLNLPIDLVIYLVVDSKVLLKRIEGRRVCPKCGASFHVENNPSKVEGKCDYCGNDLIIRKDDNPEAMKTRLEAYTSETAPLINYYRAKGLLREINALKDINEVAEDIRDTLEK